MNQYKYILVLSLINYRSIELIISFLFYGPLMNFKLTPPLRNKFIVYCISNIVVYFHEYLFNNFITYITELIVLVSKII